MFRAPNVWSATIPAKVSLLVKRPLILPLVPSYLRDCQKLISGPFSSNVSDINLTADYNRTGGNHGDT